LNLASVKYVFPLVAETSTTLYVRPARNRFGSSEARISEAPLRMELPEHSQPCSFTRPPAVMKKRSTIFPGWSKWPMRA
jgi:hypothetical protein